MKEVGLKRGVVIVMNPQTGEILALVSLPTYDNNLFARGISNADYQTLLDNPDKPLLNHAVQAHYPPGSTYKLVAGTGGLADKKITPDDEGPDEGLPDARRRPGSTTGTSAASGRATSTAASGTRATRSSSRWPASSASTGSATGRSSTGSARRPGSTCPARSPGSSRPTSGSRTRSAQPIFPGETYQAGIGQGYDVVTPIQLINAYAALANGGTLYQPQIVRDIVGPDGTVVRPFEPKVLHKLNVAGERPQDRCATPPGTRSRCATPTTSSTCPIKVAGKSGTAEFGTRDAQGPPAVPLVVRRVRPEGPGQGLVRQRPTRSWSSSPSPTTRGRRATSATEIVKYYLQLHFGIKKDYRLPNLLKRGNFYQSN